MDDNISLDIQRMDVVDDKMSTGKRYIDDVDEIFISMTVRRCLTTLCARA
jgi:hypothetical protein